MVAKIAKEVGKEVYKPRPQVVNNDKERSEVGDTESGNAGNDPISNINLNNINNNYIILKPLFVWTDYFL